MANSRDFDICTHIVRKFVGTNEMSVGTYTAASSVALVKFFDEHVSDQSCHVLYVFPHDCLLSYFKLPIDQGT